MPVEIQQEAQRENRRHDAAGELHEAGADEIADAFGVVHDARDEHAGLRLVEVPHRQAHHVLFDAPPHVGDRLLRGDAEDLRQAERRDRLHDGRAGRDPRQRSAADPSGPSR